MTTISTVSKNCSRIVWFWQHSSKSWDGCEAMEWRRYSDFESEYIEEAYQRMDLEVKLSNSIINFKLNIQFNVDDNNTQRMVKREEIHLSQYVRPERFCYSEEELERSENQVNEENSFFSVWLSKNQLIKRNFAAVANLAAEGILHEGKLLNQECDAQRMANYFHDGIKKIKNLDCAARLYTANSFLYKLVNTSLRNNDISKMDTLGPFCYLLYHRLRLDRARGDEILYRGMNLTGEILNEYKQLVGKTVVWPAFTSTSRSRPVADMYGVNTLFIIFSKDTWRPQNDISKVSYYPDEQEVLLSPFHKFIINRIELDSINGKHLIYMTSVNT